MTADNGKPSRLARLKRSGFTTAAMAIFARASNQLSTLVLTLIAARYLAPADFGVFSLAVLCTTLIRTLLYCGAYEFLLKSRTAEDYSSESLTVNFIVAAVSSLLIAVVAVGLLVFTSQSEIAWLTLALLPSNLFAALSAWQESLCLRAGRTKSYYVITSSAEIGSTIVAIALLVMQAGLMALAAKVYISAFFAAFLYWRTGTALLSTHFSRTRVVEVLKWSIERYGAVLMTFGSTYTADLILGAFLSPAATGLYRASSRVVTSVSDLFNQPARLMGMTFYSARAARDVTSEKEVPMVFSLAAAAGWAALAGLAIAAPIFIPLLLGPAWTEAIPVISVLCLARGLSLIDSCISPALVAYNRQRVIFRIQMAVVPIQIAALLLLASHGIYYAVWAVAGAGLINTSLLVFSLYRFIRPPVPILGKVVPIAVLPAASVAVAASLAYHFAFPGETAVLRLAAMVAAGVVAWAGMLLILRRPVMSILHQLKAKAP